jgi:hypothetical protein
MSATLKRNAGWFRHGKDPRRHPLTQEERRRGGVMSAAIQSCELAAANGWAHQFIAHAGMLGYERALAIFQSHRH